MTGRVLRVLMMPVLCCAAGVLCADTVRTKAGDVIQGEIVAVRKTKIVIKTAFAGTLAIGREFVESVAYDKPAERYFARRDATKKPKTEVTLTRDGDGNLLLVPVEDKAEALALSEVQTLWPATGSDPDFPPVKLWSTTVSLGLTGHSGSTEDLALSGAVSATRTTEKSTLKLYGNYYKSRSNGAETAKYFIGGFDLEHRPWEHHSWYVRDEAQHNPYSYYKLRNMIGGGYGYYLWNTVVNGRTSLLRLRIGLAYTRTEYTYRLNPWEDRYLTHECVADFGFLWHYDFVNGLGWNTEVTYSPQIDDPATATLVHESRLTYTLRGFARFSKRLNDIALESGMRNEMRMISDSDTSTTDSTVYVRMSKTW